MVRSIIVCCLIFTICGYHQVTSVPTYTIDEAIEDINFFIPGSKLVLTTAIKLWSLYGEVRNLVEPNATRIENQLEKISESLVTINDKLDDIDVHLDDISDNIKDVKDLVSDKVINQLPKELSLDHKMVTIYSEIAKVNNLFEKFVRYNDPKKRHENETLLNFADAIVDHGLNELPSVLNQIHRYLVEKYSGVNILNIIAHKRLATSMMCKRQQSAQHFINTLYNDIMIVEIKGLIMTQFAYTIKKAFKNNEVDYKTEVEEAKHEFQKRTTKTILEVKRAMARAPRDFWRCDPTEHEEDETYTKLNPIFQAYIMKEGDSREEELSTLFGNKCSNSCQSLTHVRDNCKSKYCTKTGKQCTGFVRDCQSYESHLKICLADKDSSRRYEFIELMTKGGRLGSNKNCGVENEINVSNKIHYFYKCEYCFCTCESIEPNVDRYFSLQNVTSDIENNKIITGVRFVKDHNIIHIQIQQGTLIANGNINASTLDWKPIDNFSIDDQDIIVGRDYHKISWDERGVNLDNLDGPPENVLTGLRFIVNHHHLQLEAQVTPFDFTTGSLYKSNTFWFTNEIKMRDRMQVQLQNPNLPTNSFLNEYDTTNSEFIKFTTSSLESDVGQNVVPFIDLQEVTTDPAVPMSGAALIHKGNDDSAGFLAFKLFTFDFAPYLQK